MPHEDFTGVRAPVLTSERADESQRTQETFRGDEFGEELARSRSLSENFPEQILDFLTPLLVPQQRASARGRENLIDTFRRTGGLKSSFAGQRFKDFERDASLNEILGITKGAQSFFGPLAALQQNRLAVAGAPLSRSRSTSSGSGRSFGFPPIPNPIQILPSRIDGPSPSTAGGRPRLGSGIIQGGRNVNADIDNLIGSSPDLFGPGPSFSPTLSAPVSSGGGGGGGIFFNPATGLAESTPQPGFNVRGGFDSSGGFNDDFGFGDFDFPF